MDSWWGWAGLALAPQPQPDDVDAYIEWAAASLRRGRCCDLHMGRLDTPEAAAKRAEEDAAAEREHAAAEAVVSGGEDPRKSGDEIW